MPFEKAYYPILKLKAGETDAFTHLASVRAQFVNPVFDVWPPDMTRARATAAGFPATLHKNVLKILAKANFRTIFFDPTLALQAGHAPPADVATAIFATPDPKKKIPLTQAPVFRVDVDPAAYKVMIACAKRQKLAIFRATLEEISLPTVSPFLRQLFLDLPGADISLLVDARGVVRAPVKAFAGVYHSAFRPVIAAYNWARVIVASGSMPKNLADLKVPGKIYPRTDELFFREFEAVSGGRVALGDYASITPEYSDVEFGPAAIAAKIKYLCDPDEWYIARGGVTNRGVGNFSEYGKAAKHLLKHPKFQGTAYSWAEKRIDEAANGDFGGHTTWVTVGVVRHISRTADDVSKLP